MRVCSWQASAEFALLAGFRATSGTSHCESFLLCDVHALHHARLPTNTMVNCDHRAILPGAHDDGRGARPGSGISAAMFRITPRVRDPLSRHHPMFEQSAKNGNRSPGPPLMEPGGLPDWNVQNSRRSRNLYIGLTSESQRRMKFLTNLTKASSCGLISIDSRRTA
jgi:hypothetical protein